MTTPIQTPSLDSSTPLPGIDVPSRLPTLRGRSVKEILQQEGNNVPRSMERTLASLKRALNEQGFSVLPDDITLMEALKEKVITHIKSNLAFDKIPVIGRIARFFYNLVVFPFRKLSIEAKFQKVKDLIVRQAQEQANEQSDLNIFTTVFFGDNSGRTEQAKQNILPEIAKVLASKTPEEIIGIREALGKIGGLRGLKQEALKLCDTYSITPRSLVEEFSNQKKRPFRDTSITLTGQSYPVLGFIPSEADHEADKVRLLKVLEAQNLQFHETIADISQQEGAGFIDKRDVPEGTKLFVRADLHSDLPSLLAQLKMLQEQGHLDENYACKSGFQMIFLGDYVDRGANDIEIMTLLLMLRMKNPDSVHLIRGNHEDMETNLGYNADPQFFLNNRSAIEQCYTTMPLALCIAEQEGHSKGLEGKKQRQYQHFSHGLFSPAVDLSPLISREGDSRLVVSKNPQFGEQVAEAAEKARRAFEHLKEIFSGTLAEQVSTYNWGDVAEISLPDALETGRPALSPADIHAYSRVTASTDAKIGGFMRGHSHNLMEWAVERKKREGEEVRTKIIATTLAVGNTGGCYAQYPDFASENMQGLLLTVHSKLGAWDKQPVTATKDGKGLPTFHIGERSSRMSEPLDRS